jgi:hypothetical protein
VRALSLAIALCLPFSLSGCATYRVRANGAAGIPGVDQYEGKVVWSFFWGAIEEIPAVNRCDELPLAEVRVRSNLGFSLISLATLGIASPMRLDWKCAKPSPAGGDLNLIPEPAGVGSGAPDRLLGAAAGGSHASR